MGTFQARAQATQEGKGKLGKQLDNQRKLSQAGVLAETARDNVAKRDADATAATRNWN